MGAAMARRAVQGGLPTVVWDRSPERSVPLGEVGAAVAGSVADAAGQADVVVTMVSDADAVTALATEQGLLAGLRPGSAWAQMSTIGIGGTERLAALVAQRRPDVHFVEAPVSGSRGPAEQGTLLIFASGPEAARGRVAPLFDVLGQRTLWLGPAGTGSRLKLVNNALLAFTAEGVANALGLARQLGLATASVIEAFDDGPLVSPWESAKFRRIAAGEYSAEFALSLALKDVHLALDAGGGGRFPVLAALAREWDDLVDQGLGDEDVTVVTRVLGDTGPGPGTPETGGG
jgi:3-hydroxyisobutyrate dehydrogenase